VLGLHALDQAEDPVQQVPARRRVHP